jgi:dipeptidyl aminopeptidase/acylaminoacyl peptidase
MGDVSQPTVPFGAWPSPISAADVAAGALRPFAVVPVGDEVWWSEGRPAEGGRVAVVRRDATGATTDLLPPGWNARSRVHEYGGLSWLPVPVPGGHALVFTHFIDQRLYRVDPGSGLPTALTPEPPEPAALRYADLVLGPGGTEVWCVREAHRDGKIRRSIVAVPLDGSANIREIVSGSDFLAFPRPSPDGGRLAWIAWDHPRMPWDGTELRLATLGPDGVAGPVSMLLGGPEESVLQPEWVSGDTLYVVSDRSGWWNLYRVAASGGPPEPLCPRLEEFGAPLWVLGLRTYAVLADGRLAVRHGTDADALGLLDPATGELSDLDLPYTAWLPSLTGDGDTVAGVAASPTEPLTVLRVDTATGAAEPLRRALETLPDRAYLPTPRSITVAGPGERDVHAHVYPPANPDVLAPVGERPPYVVFVHGGPTSQSSAVLDLEKAYFTSRGIGVVDVNYGGSTGYGRAYRERLRRQWGVVDVEDCVAAAQALVEAGEADPARLAIRGGSAGGWTALGALTTTDVFDAGTSYYGVAELVNFVEETHDFESRYLDGLIGTLPEDRDIYVERAPLSHVDRLSCPVLLLQGLEDPVVPPAQAEQFVDALARNGIPHAYLAFAREQHGFRRFETVVTALEAELSFYGQVFGFTPPGVPVLQLSTGEADATSAIGKPQPPAEAGR